MFFVACCLCTISLNYFSKAKNPFGLGVQLFLIFFNCIPRPLHGLIYNTLEILLLMYLQDVTRDFNMMDELPCKIFLLDIIGNFIPSVLEYTGLTPIPYFLTDFIKINLYYLYNFIYTFFLEGETIRLINFGVHVFIIFIGFVNHCRKTFILKAVHKKAKRVYSMAGTSAEDAANYLIIEQEQVLVATLHPKKIIQRTFNIPANFDFVGYAIPSRSLVFYDKQNFQYKIYDSSNFKQTKIIQSEANVAHIVHASKNLLAVFSQLAAGQDGTLITVYDCSTAQSTVSVGLSHKINKQENLLIFDSFIVDLEKTSDKLIFSFEKLLCNLDIETKVNESLSTDFSNGFTIHKVNDRRVVLCGKDDWAEMYDVPTNQPSTMRNVFLSYSRIIPITGLNNYYFVEPCCSKKNVYIMKGFGYDMQIVTYFQLGYPNILFASYNKETKRVVFLDSKKSIVYKLPLQINSQDAQVASNDFEDSIVALD
ncbi:hypothetical protein ABPG72_006379 [Tetrahymena utriculariae]